MIRVTNIVWDFDPEDSQSEDGYPHLPTEVCIDTLNERDDDAVCDYLSDTYGFCVKSFCYSSHADDKKYIGKIYNLLDKVIGDETPTPAELDEDDEAIELYNNMHTLKQSIENAGLDMHSDDEFYGLSFQATPNDSATPEEYTVFILSPLDAQSINNIIATVKEIKLDADLNSVFPEPIVNNGYSKHWNEISWRGKIDIIIEYLANATQVFTIIDPKQFTIDLTT